MNESTSPYRYSKQNAVVFLIVIVISTALTFSPMITLHYVSVDMAFSVVFILQVLFVTLIYFLYLRKMPECKIRIKSDWATVRFSILSFLLIILIQLIMYCYKSTSFHHEPFHMHWIAIVTIILVFPYYEEIIYRACAFGLLCSIYKKDIIIPSVLTSLFFSLMHFQYHNIPDQVALFIVAILLLMVRIKSGNLFYPMLMHSGMNTFVILLNIQSIL